MFVVQILGTICDGYHIYIYIYKYYLYIYIYHLSIFTSMFMCLCDTYDIWYQHIILYTHLIKSLQCCVWHVCQCQNRPAKGEQETEASPTTLPRPACADVETAWNFCRREKQMCWDETRDYSKWDLVTLGYIGCLLDSSEHVLEPIIQDLPEDVHG